MNKAVFLDRDGVINKVRILKGKPYPPGSLADFELYPETVHACCLLKKTGFLLVVATNQPDVGRGTQTQSVVESIHSRLIHLLPLNRIEVCYDSGQEKSIRRKPEPGMLLDSARILDIDLSQSFMVGDRWRDIECGHRAGCKTIFIDRHYSESLTCHPDLYATDLLDAAKKICQLSAIK